MAVGAADLALRNLRLDASPSTSRVCIRRYVRHFSTSVIELKDDDVGLTAVHTRMTRQVLDDAAPILGSSRRNISKQSGLLGLPIPPVVLMAVRGEAFTTPSLEFGLASPDRRELIQRLYFPAVRARSHEGERADTSISGEWDRWSVPRY